MTPDTPTITFTFGGREIVLRLQPLGLAQSAPVLSADIVEALQAIRMLTAAELPAATLPAVRESIAWRVAQHTATIDRAVRRLAAIGVLVHDTQPAEAAEVRAATAHGIFRPRAASASEINLRLAPLEQQQPLPGGYSATVPAKAPTKAPQGFSPNTQEETR